MDDTVLVPLEGDLAKTVHEASEDLRKAKREYSYKRGVFLDEVAATYHGARRIKGKPYLVYLIERTERS